MATIYGTFLPLVLPHVPGCPEFVAETAIRSAAIEFCERSDYLHHETDPATVVAGVARYDLDLPAQTMLGRVISASLGGVPLTPSTPDALARLYAGRDWRTVEGSPSYVTQYGTCEVILAPIPQQTVPGGLALVLSLVPSRDSQGCDSVLWERWAEQIADGALYRLHEMAGQPFFNAPAAAFRRARFEMAITKAKLERNRALGRPTMVMRPPRFV